MAWGADRRAIDQMGVRLFFFGCRVTAIPLAPALPTAAQRAPQSHRTPALPRGWSGLASTRLTRKADHLLGQLVKGVYGAGTPNACPQWAPQVQGRPRRPRGPQISDGDQLAGFTPIPVPPGREEGLRNTCGQSGRMKQGRAE